MKQVLRICYYEDELMLTCTRHPHCIGMVYTCITMFTLFCGILMQAHKRESAHNVRHLKNTLLPLIARVTDVSVLPGFGLGLANPSFFKYFISFFFFRWCFQSLTWLRLIHSSPFTLTREKWRSQPLQARNWIALNVIAFNRHPMPWRLMLLPYPLARPPTLLPVPHITRP